MTSNKKGLLIYLGLPLLIIFIAMQVFPGIVDKKPTEYNKIIKYFKDQQVEEYTLDFGTLKLTYKLRGDETQHTYEVPNLSLFVQDTHALVAQYNAEHPDAPINQYFLQPEEPSMLLSMLVSVILPIGAMVLLFYFMMRQTRGAGSPMNFARARPKLPGDEDRTTFEDVAGADEEKEELQEIVEFLRDPQKFNNLGARIPKGVLLMGPPGTGKTLLAKAVAGEAGVSFFSISGSDFVEMYVGVGASRVRDLFEQAKKGAPSVVFIDEIDAVGRHRGAGLGGGHDEREQTLNQLLVEMDGFGSNMGVIVMGATNRKDILDPALMRPGRFDRHITVGYPDVRGREDILKVHTRNKPIAPDVELRVIAQTTGGFTGADLENLANEAALLAARRNKKAITMVELEEATIKVIMGPEKRNKVILEKERNLTAYHEAGHAIVTFHCETQDKVHQVSIIPRGWAGGYTLSLPEKDTMYQTREEMKEMITTLLAGRVAESLVLGDISTGASNDLERSTKIARAMVTKFGFSKRLGPMVYGKNEHEVFLGMDLAQDRGYSEQVAALIDEEVRSIIDDAYQRTENILRSEMEKLHQLSEYLKRYEKIDGDTFDQLMRDKVTLEELISRQEADYAARKAAEEASKDKSVVSQPVNQQEGSTESTDS